MTSTTDSGGIVPSLRDVYGAVEAIRSSLAVTLVFWGSIVTLAAAIFRDGAWIGLLGIWGVALIAIGVGMALYHRWTTPR